jgi:hypothetical protein
LPYPKPRLVAEKSHYYLTPTTALHCPKSIFNARNVSKTTWKHFRNYLEILRRSKFPSSFGNSSW